MGSVIIRTLRKYLGHEALEVWALGTNAIATAQMMKAGANRGATGEGAVIRGVSRVQAVLGPVSIVLADSFMGEMTPPMACAVAQSPALKLLLPLNQEGVEVVGVLKEPLPHLVDMLVNRLAHAFSGGTDVAIDLPVPLQAERS